MSLDKATIKNLELTETLFEKKLRGSLLGVLDRTGTAMGSRKLRQWIKGASQRCDGDQHSGWMPWNTLLRQRPGAQQHHGSS